MNLSLMLPLVTLVVIHEKSIWSAKALIKEGCIWRVCNITNINIWDDLWVCSDEGRHITNEQNVALQQVN